MDPKYRVSIPPQWRPVTGEPLHLLFTWQHDLPYVKVFSQAAYNEKLALIKGSDLSPRDKDQEIGRLSMLSREVTLNDQGKLLVPKELSMQAGILAEGEVSLAGRGNFFQIWSRENFNSYMSIEGAPRAATDVFGIF